MNPSDEGKKSGTHSPKNGEGGKCTQQYIASTDFANDIRLAALEKVRLNLTMEFAVEQL